MIESKDLVVETISVELVCPTFTLPKAIYQLQQDSQPISETTVNIFTANTWHDAQVYQRESLQPGDMINSPALIIESIDTNIIEPGWQGEISERLDLILSRDQELKKFD